MAAMTPEHRFDVLRRWKASLQGRGHSLPSDSDLNGMARLGQRWSGTEDPAVEAWGPTLDSLLDQLTSGVAEPVIPSELETPTGVGTSAASSSSDPTPTSRLDEAERVALRFEALEAWRQDQLENSRGGIEDLKSFHLKALAKLSGSNIADIKARLSSSTSIFASELASVITSAVRPPTSAESLARPTEADGVDEASTRRASDIPAARSAATDADAAAEPAASRSTVESQESEGLLASEGFAPYGFAPADNAIEVITTVPGVAGTYALSWPPFDSDQPAVVYRVVASDDFVPYNPDIVDPIATTWGCTAVDARPLVAAVRHVQVWVHVGADLGSAKASAPIDHAHGAIVAQPSGVDIREDEGRVIGQWATFDGTSRVQIYRIPIARGARGHGNSEFRILGGETNLSGFVDSEAKRGSRYLYSFAAEAALDDYVQLSVPIMQDVVISDVLEPVLDLVIDAHGGEEDRSFDLTWTPPTGGTVVVYRTAEPPRAGIEVRPVSEDALIQANLTIEDRLAHPVSSVDGSHSMRDVPWPRGWTRAYFTPVTLLGGHAHVGTTIAHAGPRSILAARVTERVNREIVTFSWPEGAASVQIFVSVSGAAAESVIHGSATVYEISAKQYKEAGGFAFPSQLPRRGCDIHLVPVAFQAGNRVQGRPTTVSYPGLTRVRYEVKVLRNFLQSVTGASVTIFAVGENFDRPLNFALIHNRDRFPLSVMDGVPVSLAREDSDGAVAGRRVRVTSLGADPGVAGWKSTPETWKAEVGPAAGYLRLFVDLPSDELATVALLDPPARTLRLERNGFFGGQ